MIARRGLPRRRNQPPAEVVIDYRPLSSATPRELLAREPVLVVLARPIPKPMPQEVSNA